MRTTRTLLDSKARAKVAEGVRAIYEPVRRTLGPEGKNALLYRTFNRGPRITNDGVTVSEVILPKDPYVRMAAEAFKEVCKRTNEKVGDGTTGTAVVAGKLFEHVNKLILGAGSAFVASSTGVMSLRKQILEEAETIKAAIKIAAKPIKNVADLEKVAVISVEDAGLGKVVAAMAYEVGTEGFIDVVEGYKGEIETELIKGMRFPAKIAAKGFVNNPARYETVVQDTPALITNYNLDNLGQVAKFMVPLLEHTTKAVIFAPSFSAPVLEEIYKVMFTIDKKGNRVTTGFVIYPIAVPSLRTEQFEDLAIYCGARFINKDIGAKLENLNLGSGGNNDLGFIEKLVVKDVEAKEDALAMGGRGTKDIGESSAVKDRIKTLQGQAKEARTEMVKKSLERRAASMASAVAVIRVGGSTQADSLYRKLKVEDAVFACKAALRGGYVDGGGLCLKKIAEKLPETSILKEALLAPHTQIMDNAGGQLDIGKDVIDSAESVYYAVEHATSVVANLITVEIMIPEEEEASPADGYFAIARMIGEFVINNKRQLGYLKENEEEMERDRLLAYEGMEQNDS